MSSRRTTNKRDILAEYKRAREGGGRNWKPEKDTEIYDEVDEIEYKKIVKGRLQRDDFIEDDGVGGYADNGMDDWGDNDQDIHSEEERVIKQKKKVKSGKNKPPPPPPVAPSISDYRPKPSLQNESDFMASLMGSMTNITPDTSIRSRKRKPRSPSPQSSSPAGPLRYRKTVSYADTSSDGFSEDPGATSSDMDFTSPKKKPKMNDTIGLTPAVEKMGRVTVEGNSSDFDDSAFDAFDDISMDILEELDDGVRDIKPLKLEPKEINIPSLPLSNRKLNSAAAKKEEETPSWLNMHASLTVATDDSLGPLASRGNGIGKPTDIDALEEDGSLRFFWLDYLEQDGHIHFIGKLKDKASGSWVSCGVTVENMERNLYVLPRERRVMNDYETDIAPSLPDVYKDFDEVRKNAGIKSFKGKFVNRNYAFGEPDVPRGESKWMKVVYPFTEPQIANNVSSPNFSRIFGTGTSAFELLVLKRKIMGPCWLQIKKPHVEHKARTWCKFEATVEDPKDINPIPESDPTAPKETPPLTIMSLSVRTIVNHKENKREIVCASARTWSNIDIEDPTPPDQQVCTVQTFVRPLDKFPAKFQQMLQSNKKSVISAEASERVLLNRLLMAIHKADPDVIVGHEFLGVTLDVLLTRMRDLKADNWSRIGRFKRTRWPPIGKQGTNLRFLSGRLMCDLASDGAKSMIASTSWSLTEMCATHLKCERQDIDPDDTTNYFDSGVSSPGRLLTFVRHCELDAHYQMAIAAKVQILPLTKQLTNLAGNSWNKTLNGGRAERNEYILLHEFHRLKYICPDKQYGKKAVTVIKPEPEEHGDEVAVVHRSKRDKYKGGLVFEPKRGLWDKYILVMDFNSLYPSIIQEFNIDFITVEPVPMSADGEEKYPVPPEKGVPQGVLPRLIATLVSRRRQVKNLMKDRSVTGAKLMQYDIKQQALKLTANSMYGCLGFEYSRFYARQLAALTTLKGREILTDTRRLAESLQLDVVYGDTDSVFVNTNVTDFKDAIKISNEFKKQVNERYRLLEIDLDSVFQRLLLLQKKKYAALKMEDETRTSIEVKGLDMKRREFCALSKDCSQYVLKHILSGEATETVVENIHEYLSSLGNNIRNGKVDLEDFIIYKRLGKNPEDYPDAKGLPHVSVALRMKTRGGNAKAGDVIPYIFCVSTGEDAGQDKDKMASRARHPEEIRKSTRPLLIDYEYYITNQILPPIERLCEPIEGTDRSRIAQQLGLDPARYRNHSADGDEDAFGALESQIPDSIRFKDAAPLVVHCRKCTAQMPFSHIYERETSILHASGVICAGCQAPITMASLQTQLEVQIRMFISRYYEGWMLCNDPVCRNKTRMMGVYGRRCLKVGCSGTVTFEYSDAQLYKQLMYFQSLFDAEKAVKNAKGTSAFDTVNALAVHPTPSSILRELHRVVDKYLNQCGRGWVELPKIFAFMKV